MRGCSPAKLTKQLLVQNGHCLSTLCAIIKPSATEMSLKDPGTAIIRDLWMPNIDSWSGNHTRHPLLEHSFVALLATSDVHTAVLSN
jgi:hypothetical protein